MAFTGGLMKGMGYTGQNLIGKSFKDSINSIDLFFWDRSLLEHDHYFRLVPQTLHIIRLMDSAVSFFPTGITFQSSVWWNQQQCSANHTIPYHPNMPTNLYATAPNRWSGLKSHFFFTMWPHVNTTVTTSFVNIGIKMSSLTHFHGVFFLIIGKAFYRFVEKLVEMNEDIMWR